MEGFKKYLLTMLFVFIAASSIFAASINPSKGYKDLEWGTTVNQAKNKGYKLSILNENQAAPLKKNFSEKVDIYFVKATDKVVLNLYFVYYKDKLFCVYEIYEKSFNSLKDFQTRFGSNIKLLNSSNIYSDVQNGISSVFIHSDAEGCTSCIYNYSVYTQISKINIGKLETSPSGIVGQLDGLAKKLLQEPKAGSKATYAFLDLTTDNKNSLVEKYITDALIEAVFNTGKVKIIERSNIEKIIAEQKFQSSGLVNETQAANIGNIAGVEYVCYGTIKEIEGGYTVNARVVDVETAEICAMSRMNITKDSYLQNNYSGSKAGVRVSSGSSARTPSNSLWTCSKNRNEFDGYTTYYFCLKGSDSQFLFVGYDKYDNSFNSKVRAGIYWDRQYYNTKGTYDFKTETQGTVTKKYDTEKYSPLTGWKEDKNSFYFTYNKNESAKFFLDLFGNNNYITLRHDELVRRFQTQGFWETVEANGITKEEILSAVSNEEF